MHPCSILNSAQILHASIRMKLTSLLAGFVWLALPLPGFTADAAVIGSARAFLERNGKKYLQQNHLHGRLQIEFFTSGSRLPGKPCPQPPALSLEGRAPIGRLNVRVRCTATGWTLLLPAQVSIWQQVLAARHPLKRGQTLSEEDVIWLERDIGVLPHGWLSDIARIQGQQLKRSLGAGQLLLYSQLKEAPLIAAGDQVQIFSQSTGFRVQMSGEALSAGRLGQQIRVRNLSSGRVLRARVTARAQVEVDTPGHIIH